jgi:sulfofructose kinase
MDKQWDVLGFGAVTVDDLVYVDRYPYPDMKVVVLDQQRQGGGLVGTALVAASRLGARTAYAGILGDDDLSHYTLDELMREGVDCSPVLHRPEARPIHSIIIVDPTGQRSILPSFVGVQWRSRAEIPEALIASSRVLFVDHHAVEGSLRAIEIAHAHSIPVVADIERESEPGVLQMLSTVDHLIVGIGFAHQRTGLSDPAQAAQALSEGRACAVVTAGEQGCWYVTREQPDHATHQPAFRVEVVDTTGCGDVFHGAYAAMLAQGEPIDQIIQIATATAAMKATRPGGRAGIPNRTAVTRFIRNEPV